MPVRRDKPVPAMSLDTYRLLRLGRDLEPTGHVCGNCRNQWFKSGREDCPNNEKNRAKEQSNDH